ncbi:MAG: bifunctional (p)ppGpp synthetase/guanosine-3',5'-bis(diphosphate) 3'-pyrophosphohydrolase [Chloroflexota bacterium]
MNSSALLDKAREYLPPDKVTLVQAACDFAIRAHEGQVRKSGKPFVEHPLSVATTLAELQLDAATLAAAMLHDVVEDSGIPIEEVQSKFGQEVAGLVDAATKLSKVNWTLPAGSQTTPGQAPQAENLRKMLIAMAEDIRVVFIKLADRLHNMRTLNVLPEDRRRVIAKETLEIFAPLAHRVGMWEVKWQLEDLSFRYLEPREYHRIARRIAIRRAEREQLVNDVIKTVAEELEKVGVKAEVTGRPKHIYSIYEKTKKYAALGKDFNDIHDLQAVRILVDNVSDCYKALGVIHGLWHPILEEFNDYIANPKDNGYQSLHTTVLVHGSTPLEMQIRTYEMHRIAEYGVAAHWRYKDGEVRDLKFEEKMTWLRQLIDWQKELNIDQFMESVKTDIFTDQVFVFTPKGEIKALPRDATPLDFAYLIHTELGHRCIGAKVNGKLVPLNHILSNGDIVEIMTTKGPKAPSFDWLNADLGYLNTSHARTKVRQWFKKQEKSQNIERGRQLLEKELKRLGLGQMKTEEVASQFGYAVVDDFYEALGDGDISTRQIDIKLTASPEEPKVTAEAAAPKRPPSGIRVLGVGDLLTNLARCCNPVPGDEIIGYVTRSSGVSVHRKDCRNIIHVREPERLIGVEWAKGEEVYPVGIQVQGWERVGLLRDITNVIAEDKVNIIGVNVVEHNDETSTLNLVIEVRNMAQLVRLMSKTQAVRGVISVARSGDARVNISQAS